LAACAWLNLQTAHYAHGQDEHLKQCIDHLRIDFHDLILLCGCREDTPTLTPKNSLALLGWDDESE